MLYIFAICELPTGETLVLDFYHHRVKLLDKKYQFVSNCVLSSYSYDMCLISSSEVAVTTNESSSDDGLHGLHIISVRNDRLEKGRKLQLSHKCVGIAHHEDALYVTFGTALYQYTLNGNLVKELYEDTTGYNTVYSCAVNLKSDKIYVTSLHKHSLLTLDKDGNAISTFTDIDLKGPQGVHVTPSGQVLVCGETTHTIIQVDSDGKKKLATLATKKDGINGPRSVFYSSSTYSVIVSLATNDSIMVFKVTEGATT